MLHKHLYVPICLTLGLIALGRPAFSQLQFHVNLDTSPLNPASTFYTEFTLSDGQVQGLGTPGVNSVTLSDFTFGTGSAGAVLPPDIGNASGSTASSVLLADGDPGGVADFAQAFTPGANLGFNVSATTFANSGGIPDTFTIYLLDAGLNYLTTNAPAQTPNAVLRVDITGPTMTIANVQTYGSRSVPVPTITPLVTTPEPGAFALGVGIALGGALPLLRRRRCAKRG